MDWRDFLTGKRARDDLFDTFPPEQLQDLKPALINAEAAIVAARVGAEVLRVIAKRGGTRIDTSSIAELTDVLDDVLPDSAVNLCEDEAARVLGWLDRSEDRPTTEAPASSLPPELDLMLAADIDSRISVARLAIDEEYDVELEYFDEESNSWPRLRGQPVELVDQSEGETGEGEIADRTDILLAIELDEETLHVPVRTIRWLMPVTPTRPPTVESDEGGEVLEFPGSQSEQAPGEEESSDEPPEVDGTLSDEDRPEQE
ncbi:MAG: hypothetical protein ABEL76_13485 [Bradymonadaceae bacterium]